MFSYFQFQPATNNNRYQPYTSNAAKYTRALRKLYLHNYFEYIEKQFDSFFLISTSRRVYYQAYVQYSIILN